MSISDAVLRATRGGAGGLYAGFRATVVLDTSYAVVQFFFLERFRVLALRCIPTPPSGVRHTSPSSKSMAKFDTVMRVLNARRKLVSTTPLVPRAVVRLVV